MAHAKLSNAAWADFRAAAAKAKGLKPDGDARALLSKILFEELPAYAAYDPMVLEKQKRRGTQMLNALARSRKLPRRRAGRA
jgi:hypothetical protein